MFSSGGCSVNVGGKTRCLEALLGDKENTRFIIGTTSLQQPNQLRIVHYDSTNNDVAVVQSFAHDAQVLAVAPSPVDKALVVTCSKVAGQPATATLWRMPIDDAANSEATRPLELVAELPPQKLPVSTVTWNASDDTASSSTSLASAHGTALRTWTLADGALTLADKLELDVSLAPPGSAVGAVRFDPHHPHFVAFTLGGAVQTWDTRSKSVAFSIADAHSSATVLDVDYNPNKPYCVASGGADGKMRFWDVRHARLPLLSLQAHTHWVYSVRYNRCHDQLVLSASSDSTVALWRVSSISSAPIVELDDADLMSDTTTNADVVDTKIKSYDEHEDSVYATAWAANDSWLFASVSYDGRLCVNQVPSTEKYKILL